MLHYVLSTGGVDSAALSNKSASKRHRLINSKTGDSSTPVSKVALNIDLFPILFLAIVPLSGVLRTTGSMTWCA